jgi:hypothetical protein
MSMSSPADNPNAPGLLGNRPKPTPIGASCASGILSHQTSPRVVGASSFLCTHWQCGHPLHTAIHRFHPFPFPTTITHHHHTTHYHLPINLLLLPPPLLSSSPLASSSSSLSARLFHCASSFPYPWLSDAWWICAVPPPWSILDSLHTLSPCKSRAWPNSD